jgi:hypothetical protein
MDPSKTKTGLDVSHAEKYHGCRILPDLCVINIDVDLNLNMTISYWGFVCNWCNLIHDNICRVNNCKAIPYYSIVLSFFNDDTLSGMTKVL